LYRDIAGECHETPHWPHHLHWPQKVFPLKADRGTTRLFTSLQAYLGERDYHRSPLSWYYLEEPRSIPKIFGGTPLFLLARLSQVLGGLEPSRDWQLDGPDCFISFLPAP